MRKPQQPHRRRRIRGHQTKPAAEPPPHMGSRPPDHRLLRLIPRKDIWLALTGHGDERRFAALFLKTWRRIPLGDRRHILRHWREDQFRMMGGMYPPAIILLGYPLELERGAIRPVLGRVRVHGHSIEFWGPAFDLMSDDVASALIAHELVHVLFRAVGHNPDYWKDEPDPFDMEEAEVADHMLHNWGFDDDVIDLWCDQNRDALDRLINDYKEATQVHLAESRACKPQVVRQPAKREASPAGAGGTPS